MNLSSKIKIGDDIKDYLCLINKYNRAKRNLLSELKKVMCGEFIIYGNWVMCGEFIIWLYNRRPINRSQERKVVKILNRNCLLTESKNATFQIASIMEFASTLLGREPNVFGGRDISGVGALKPSEVLRGSIGEEFIDYLYERATKNLVVAIRKLGFSFVSSSFMSLCFFSPKKLTLKEKNVVCAYICKYKLSPGCIDTTVIPFSYRGVCGWSYAFSLASRGFFADNLDKFP